MRVIGRLRRDEGGAVLLIVALVLVVMLGMGALSVDLGALTVAKRRMVNAADAGSLAAAQQCARTDGGGEGGAQAASDEVATANDAAATRAGWSVSPAGGCGQPLVVGQMGQGGRVTVRYERDLELFFAPVFGIDSSTTGASATAVWGVARSAGNPMPIRVNSADLMSCIAGAPGGTTTCNFGFDNTNSSQWGFLQFPEWNTQACAGGGGGTPALGDYIAGTGAPFPAVLNDPGPTWACADTGFNGNGTGQAAAAALRNLAAQQAMRFFPVADSSVPPSGIGAGLSYPIIAFTPMRIVGFWEGKKDVNQYCPGIPTGDASLFCLQLRWEGPQAGGSFPGSGAYYGLAAVRLAG